MELSAPCLPSPTPLNCIRLHPHQDLANSTTLPSHTCLIQHLHHKAVTNLHKVFFIFQRLIQNTQHIFLRHIRRQWLLFLRPPKFSYRVHRNTTTSMQIAIKCFNSTKMPVYTRGFLPLIKHIQHPPRTKSTSLSPGSKSSPTCFLANAT